MDELNEVQSRLKKKHQMDVHLTKPSRKASSNHYSRVFTRVLIAVIFVLISTIYVKWDKKNLENYKNTVFDATLSFTKINSWYEKNFGKVLPIQLNPKNEPVVKGTNDLGSMEDYHDGFAFQVSKGSAINTLNSGIVVFIGEKENYGNVVIVQGVDGVDIWYGNITNVNLSLYDYVNKNTLLGEAKEDKIYFVFGKDGAYLDYEEYTKQI